MAVSTRQHGDLATNALSAELIRRGSPRRHSAPEAKHIQKATWPLARATTVDHQKSRCNQRTSSAASDRNEVHEVRQRVRSSKSANSLLRIWFSTWRVFVGPKITIG